MTLTTLKQQQHSIKPSTFRKYLKYFNFKYIRHGSRGHEIWEQPDGRKLAITLGHKKVDPKAVRDIINRVMGNNGSH